MSLATRIPIRVEPEAAEYADRRGLRAALDAMLAHAGEVVEGLRSVVVRLAVDPEEGTRTILIEASYEDGGEPAGVEDQPEWRWDRWAVATFPPEVNVHFCFLASPETGDDPR
jgi:hypothetical protein